MKTFAEFLPTMTAREREIVEAFHFAMEAWHEDDNPKTDWPLEQMRATANAKKPEGDQRMNSEKCPVCGCVEFDETSQFRAFVCGCDDNGEGCEHAERLAIERAAEIERLSAEKSELLEALKVAESALIDLGACEAEKCHCSCALHVVGSAIAQAEGKQ